MRRIILIFLVCSLSICGICAIPAGAVSSGMEYETLPEEEAAAVMERVELRPVQDDSQRAGIQCFDISQDGTIALGIGSGSGSRLYVYGPAGEFQYGYRFRADGDYGIVFQGEALAIFFLRGNEMVVLDSAGTCVAVQKLVNATENYPQLKEILNRTVKETAGRQYLLERNLGIGDAYSRLVAVDTNGERTILYDVTPRHTGGQIVLAAFLLGFFAVVAAGCVKKMKNALES